MPTKAASAPPSAMSRALARDRLGIPAVLAFIMAGVAPLTVAAGVIPSAYATTGLTGIPAAFIVIAGKSDGIHTAQRPPSVGSSDV